MIDPMTGNKCPKYGQDQMPRWVKDETATARACQNCGFIEERQILGETERAVGVT